MSTSTETIRNGVDTAQLFGTLDAVKADPALARFQFRARNRWIDGAHNRSLDYGTSAVWLGALGALTAGLVPRARSGDRTAQAVVAGGAAAFVISVAFFPLLAATEHGIAFAIGAGAVWISGRRSAAPQSARSAAATASVPAESA